MTDKAKVVAHPTFRRMPEPIFPLASKQAREEYETIGRLLFKRGELTLERHRALCAYAGQVDSVQTALENGRRVTTHMWDHIGRTRRALKLDDLDRPIAAPVEARNKFSICGWSTRR